MTSSAGKATQEPERIRHPENLDLPPEAADVFAALSPEGSQTFSQEILHALIKAQMKGNLRPVRDVVEAWYKTLVAVRSPLHAQAATEARGRPGRSLPVEKLREELFPS